MLIFDVSINKRKHIDEIHVQRVEESPAEGICGYKIRKPKGFDDIIIQHRYYDGYFPLMVKVVNILNRRGYRPKK